MIYPILGLTWLVVALFMFVARQMAQPGGVAPSWLLIYGALLLAGYDFFRWAMAQRKRRPTQPPPPEKKEDTPPPVVNPEFKFDK